MSDGSVPKYLWRDDEGSQVHVDYASVRDLISHAKAMSRRANSEAEWVEAPRLTALANFVKERAGGDLDIMLRLLADGSETRQ